MGIRVTVKQDKSLGKFCKNMRSARRGTAAPRMVLNEDRIKALDELGFIWGFKTTSFYWKHSTAPFVDKMKQSNRVRPSHFILFCFGFSMNVIIHLQVETASSRFKSRVARAEQFGACWRMARFRFLFVQLRMFITFLILVHALFHHTYGSFIF